MGTEACSMPKRKGPLSFLWIWFVSSDWSNFVSPFQQVYSATICVTSGILFDSEFAMQKNVILFVCSSCSVSLLPLLAVWPFLFLVFPDATNGKKQTNKQTNPPANAGGRRDLALILGSGRCPGGGHGNPLQCSCLENPMDRGAWQATVRGVAVSDTTERLTHCSSCMSLLPLPEFFCRIYSSK